MRDLIEKACIYELLNNKVFYASILIQACKIEDTRLPAPAAIFINKESSLILLYNSNIIRDLLEKITPKPEKIKRIATLLEHELLHFIHDHFERGKTKHKLMWNIATDCAINQLLNKEHIQQLNGVLPNLLGLPENKNAEFYYSNLLKKAKVKHIKDIKYKITADKTEREVNIGELKGSDLTKNIKTEIKKQIIKEAYQQHIKSKGELPSGIEELIKQILEPPKISWTEVIKEYLGNMKTGYKSTWKRPSRRFGETQKGVTPDRIAKVIIALDTSGSISNKELKDFLREVRGILESYNHKLTVIQCDATIQSVKEIQPYEQDLPIKIKGRGGTSFKPVFDYVQKKMFNDVDILIYMTDLYGDQGSLSTPPFNVIWCVTKDYNKENKPKFGRILEVELKHK